MSAALRNPALLCAFRAAEMSLFPIAVITIFWQYELGLSMSEIFLLQAIFAGTTGLLEFPSGYVADRIGYRRTLVLSSGCTLAGWTVYLFSPDFWTIAAAEVVLGTGLSLVSGTDSAILYESLAQSGQEARFPAWYGRVRFFGQAAEGSAALVAGWLYAISPRAPFVAEILVWAIALAIAWCLVEPERHRSQVTGAVSHMTGVLRQILRGAPRLRVVMALTVALSMTSFVPVWIIQLYSERAGVAVSWLGPIWAAANYSVALASLGSARLREAAGAMPALLLCIALAGAGFLGLGLSHAWWGFAFYFLITMMRGLNAPILHHEEQLLIPSGDRATFLSARNLAFRGLFVVIGPSVGYAIDRSGEHAVLLVVGAIAVTASLSLWLLMLRSPAEPPGPAARADAY